MSDERMTLLLLLLLVVKLLFTGEHSEQGGIQHEQLPRVEDTNQARDHTGQ